MILTTALGQHLDTQNPQDEASYWRIVHAKSAPFFAAAFSIGALMGGATDEGAAQLRQIGALYGEMIQISDDLGDVMENVASPDWTQGCASLPILFAQSVPHPEQKRFQAGSFRQSTR